MHQVEAKYCKPSHLAAFAALFVAICLLSILGCYTEIAFDEDDPSFEATPRDIAVTDTEPTPDRESVAAPSVEAVNAVLPVEATHAELPPLPTLSPNDSTATTTEAGELLADPLDGGEPIGQTTSPVQPESSNPIVDSVDEQTRPEETVVATSRPSSALPNPNFGDVAEEPDGEFAKGTDDWPAFLGPPPTSFAETKSIPSPVIAKVDESRVIKSDMLIDDNKTKRPVVAEPPLAGQVTLVVEPVRVATANPTIDVLPTRETSVVVEARNTRHVVWLLSSKLSFALLAGDESPATAQAMVDAEQLAKVLRIELPVLPATPSAGDVLGIGRAVGEQIGLRLGPDHAALAEIAFKTNILLAVYVDRREMVHPISGATSAAAVRAGVAEPIWRAWQGDIIGASDISEARDAVFRFQQSIERTLASTEIAADPLFR